MAAAEQLVEAPTVLSPLRTAERIVDIPVPQDVEELVEVSRVFPQGRIQQRFVEQTDETPDISLGEKIVEKPGNTRVQHVVDTVKTGEVPLLQFTDKVGDIPVVALRQILKLQHIDEVVDADRFMWHEARSQYPCRCTRN